jgi:hypothetical protein
MKKLVLACILMSCMSFLKAQDLKAKSADSLVLSIDKYVKEQNESWNLLKSTLKVNEKTLAINNTSSYVNFNSEYIKDNMPIVVLGGNSKIPVAKLEGFSKMLVVPLISDDDLKMSKKKARAFSY